MTKTLNREKIIHLIKTQCNGNYNLFGRELGMDPAQVYKFLNTGVGAGKNMHFALVSYCDKKNLNYQNYFDV